MNTLYLIPVMLYLGVMSTLEVPTSKVPTSKVEENLIDFHENGVKQVSANFKKNKLSGAWKSWFANGAICDSGKFTGNVPDGEWKSWYPDGSPRFIWHFNARKLASLKDELMRQPKNRMFVLSQKPVDDAVRSFQTKYWYKDEVKQSHFTTRSALVYSSALSKEDLLELVDENTVHFTEKYRLPFAEALLHGSYMAFYPNGAVKEDGLYINGLREGAWEEFSTDGSRARGSYRHGIKAGEWRYYDKQGKLLSFVRYKNNGEEAERYTF